MCALRAGGVPVSPHILRGFEPLIHYTVLLCCKRKLRPKELLRVAAHDSGIRAASLLSRHLSPLYKITLN